MRNQFSNTLVQIPTTSVGSPYVCLTDPLQNLALNQLLMYNTYMMPDWSSASMLTANKVPIVNSDVSAAKLPQNVNIDASPLIYPQVLTVKLRSNLKRFHLKSARISPYLF